MNNIHKINDNIYIINDEEIKEGDWYYYNSNVRKHVAPKGYSTEDFKKIILTTDVNLINDNVQAIDDTFLEWFVKNPSCEEVKIGEGVRYEDEWIDNEDGGEIFQHQYCCYKIIIPNEEPKQIKCYCGHTIMCDCGPLEEPKQESLEEAAERYTEEHKWEEQDPWLDFIEGAKWAQERMYSEEDLKEAFKGGGKMSWTDINQETQEPYYYDFNEWFEQFKKK